MEEHTDNLLDCEDLRSRRIELAREMFRSLENERAAGATEIARRAFCIQDRLAAIKD